MFYTSTDDIYKFLFQLNLDWELITEKVALSVQSRTSTWHKSFRMKTTKRQ